MMGRPTRAVTDQGGFTLLEILVALLVLGFLLLGLSEGVRFGLRAWDTETKLVDRGADMDAMERVLRGLIVAADPGDFNEQPPFHGTSHTVAFQSRLPTSGTGLVTRAADIGLGVDAKHRLVLRWSQHPHAERLTRPEPPHETVLLEGVDQVAFSYLRAADHISDDRKSCPGGSGTLRRRCPSQERLLPSEACRLRLVHHGRIATRSS